MWTLTVEREGLSLRATGGQIGTNPSDETRGPLRKLRAKLVSTRGETSRANRKLKAKRNAPYREEEGQAFSVTPLNPRGKR